MIHLNIGSNLKPKFGNKFQNISLAITLLIESEINILKISDFYETPSYPNKFFPKFINIGILISCNFDVSTLLKKINLIEKKIGRVRLKKNDPRVCDIDIIDFNGLIIYKKNLKIPHIKSHIRNFVLYPISEIDPEWVHPVIKKSVNFLINNLDTNFRIEITRLNKNVINKR